MENVVHILKYPVYLGAIYNFKVIFYVKLIWRIMPSVCYEVKLNYDFTLVKPYLRYDHCSTIKNTQYR